jgi:hypothetical protein
MMILMMKIGTTARATAKVAKRERGNKVSIFLNRRSVGLLTIILLVALFTGCGDKQDTAAEQTETVKEEAAAEAPAALTAEEEAMVAKMATIATALEETPAAAGAILEKYSMTVEEYEAEIFKIASNPALSEAFEKAKNK